MGVLEGGGKDFFGVLGIIGLLGFFFELIICVLVDFCVGLFFGVFWYFFGCRYSIFFKIKDGNESYGLFVLRVWKVFSRFLVGF